MIAMVIKKVVLTAKCNRR